MKETVNVSWQEKMWFEVAIEDYKIKIDADPEHGGNRKGPKPKPLLLAALGGCAGMDVVSILGKMRVVFDDFRVSVEGDLTEEHPKHFYHILVKYEFKGVDLPYDKLRKAVDLSEERYCGVSETLKKALEIESEIWVNDEKI
jgi:putative redox protein